MTDVFVVTNYERKLAEADMTASETERRGEMQQHNLRPLDAADLPGILTK